MLGGGGGSAGACCATRRSAAGCTPSAAIRQAALLAGIDVRQQITVVFAAMGALYGLAGLMLVARLSSAPPTAGQGLELNVIAAAVIGGTSLMGGRGTVAGAVIGALLMESLANGMSLMNLPSSYQSIAVGLVLLFAVYVDVQGPRRPRRRLDASIPSRNQELGERAMTA